MESLLCKEEYKQYMQRLRLKRRHRLKHKEVNKLSEQLKNTFGKEILTEQNIDIASALEFDVIFIKNEIIGIIDDKPFLTVKGLLKYKPNKKYVTVDMGAVIFVNNGADVMTPGIIDADLDIQKDDFVWIRDEKNLQPLAIGRALISGKEMIEMNRGKAINSIHYVGDKLWNWSAK